MKVITRLVNIQDRRFVLIQMEDKDLSEKSKSLNGYFGTIDYEELDEKGKMKRALNGLEMALCPTLDGAIDYRNDLINTAKFANLDEGERMAKIVEYFKNKLSKVGA